mgnify:CR=1 FL=1
MSDTFYYSLGKTLQSITLLWTLLKQGFDGSPIAQKVLIVTPTSLVSNWESEIEKWLEGQVRVLALCESTRADVISGIAGFLAPRSLYQVHNLKLFNIYLLAYDRALISGRNTM